MFHTFRWLILMFILMSVNMPVHGQKDLHSLDVSDSIYQFNDKSLVIPALLIGYGLAQYSLEGILDLNLKIRGVVIASALPSCQLDDYTQFAPAVAVYGLNLAGVKGKHGFADRTLILGTSLMIMHGAVHGIKYLSGIQRPDNTSFNAFPSGHTATAFSCATFLFQEYRDVSIWYGVAGYSVATATGILRIINNRHWLTDVVAGAGFGILSSQVAYWAFPKIRTWIYNSLHMNLSVLPVVPMASRLAFDRY